MRLSTMLAPVISSLDEIYCSPFFFSFTSPLLFVQRPMLSHTWGIFSFYSASSSSLKAGIWALRL